MCCVAECLDFVEKKCYNALALERKIWESRNKSAFSTQGALCPTLKSRLFWIIQAARL